MFRRHAAGVAIITANFNGVPFGFTATSVASLSARRPGSRSDMAHTSSSWPAVANTTSSVSNMLGLGEPGLADRFARTSNRFEGDHWALGPHEVPILNDVAGWLIGKVQMRLSFENNAVVVVEVVEGEVGADALRCSTTPAPTASPRRSITRSEPLRRPRGDLLTPMPLRGMGVKCHLGGAEGPLRISCPGRSGRAAPSGPRTVRGWGSPAGARAGP